MNNVGLEIVFWVILSLYIFTQLGVFKKKKRKGRKEKMKYHLYDENERHQGCFESVEKLRNFLCDRKYDISCDADLSCTFDYIKHIKWYFEIEE